MRAPAKPGSAFRRWPLAVLAALTVGGLATAVWHTFQQHEARHAAQIIERESYATRSHLARQLDTQFRALEAVAHFWSDYGHLTADQWDQDAQIELSHFHGFERILWTDPQRNVRYATATGENIALDRRPDDAEWKTLQPIMQGIDPGAARGVTGPTRGDDGHMRYRVHIPASGPGSSGMLIALVDAREQIEQLLVDQSPGYAIEARWNGEVIYQRGAPAADLPAPWSTGGLIALPVGAKWQVTHAPTAELAATLNRPTLVGLLAAGWLIAALFGGVVLQNLRVRERAEAAERAEREYVQLNAELEERVSERTSDLETISQSVGHDVRNALNTISVTSRLLRDSDSIDEVPQRVDRIQAAVHQTASMLDRVQTYTSVTFAELDRELVDMEATASKVCRTIGADWEGEFTVAALPPCRAQPVLVEILLHNLLSNAAKFSRHHDSPQIMVGADTETQPTVYWVRDNGSGFDVSEQDDIFRPFVQLQANGEGQGLGLAIVARIARRHQGKVWAESRPGAGAVFKFELGPESVVT